MARSHKKQENTIIENLPAESGHWIKQPWNLTFVKGEMSLTQLNIMFSLVYKLQSNINEVLRGNEESLFPDAVYDKNMNLKIRIPLSEVVDHPQRYKDVEISAYRLYNIHDIIEYKGEDGELHRKMSHLFASVDVPVIEGTTRRKGEIVFEINKSMIDQVFKVERYINYIKGIVGNFRSGHSARLYMYIKAYLSNYDPEKGFARWVVGYTELREMIGCRVWASPGKDENGNNLKETWIEKKYARYNHFKEKVLESARKELEELAKENKVECYFSYDEISDTKAVYETGPKKISFKIWLTEFGKAQRQAIGDKSNVYKIEGILRNELNLKTTQIRTTLNLITPENSDFLLKKIQELKVYILTHEEIKAPEKYIYKSLKEALREWKNGSKETDNAESEEAEYVEYEEVKESPFPTPQKPSIPIVENRCTEAVKKFWEVRWSEGENRGDIEKMNKLITTLDVALQKVLPDYDISKLEEHLNLFAITSVKYPTSAVILDFIKQEEGIINEDHDKSKQQSEHAAAIRDRRRSAPVSMATSTADFE